MARDRARTNVIVSGANAALARPTAAPSKSSTAPPPNVSSFGSILMIRPPHAILFDGRGEFLSGEALRWCTRRGVVIVMPDGPGSMMTLLHSAAEASDSATLARRRTGHHPRPMRRRSGAQSPAPSCKRRSRRTTPRLGPRVTPAMPRTINRALDELAGARSVAEIVMIEAHAASVYWRSWRDLGLIERKGGNLPRSGRASPRGIRARSFSATNTPRTLSQR